MIVDRGHPDEPEQDDPETLTLNMYDDAMPIHDNCLYHVLPKVLGYVAHDARHWTSSNITDFSLDKLYNCIEQSTVGRFPKALGLNYYEAQEASCEQWWVSTRGQESLVADPVDIPQLSRYYAQVISDRWPTDSDQSVGRPSGPEMPEDMTKTSLETLDGAARNSFIATTDNLTSDTTVEAVRSSPSHSYWESQMKADMPWLWDLPFDDLESCVNLNWHQIYRNLDRMATFGSPDAILGLVNRRRIWKVCNQLAVMYAAEIQTVIPYLPDRGTEDNLLRHSKSPYIPRFVAVCEETRIEKAKAILGPNPLIIDSGPLLLKSYWNSDDHLKGISVEMRGFPKRTFGLEASSGDTTKRIVIDRGDSIRGITVYVGEAIKGLDVSTVSAYYPFPNVLDGAYRAHLDGSDNSTLPISVRIATTMLKNNFTYWLGRDRESGTAGFISKRTLSSK